MKTAMLITWPLIASLTGLGLWISGQPGAICWTAAITVLVAGWWITEPIEIPATSLIPLAVFPLVGVLDVSQVAAAYGNKLILLMLGGFMLSAAMERSGAHRRIALAMVRFFGGGSARSLVFGFMAASAVLSMWISNAASTLMLLPIVMAVVAQTNNPRLHLGLLLGTAYAASIGGIGTPIGTPPNVVFISVYQDTFGEDIGFLTWMKWTFPILAIMLPCAAIWLSRGLGAVEPLKLPEVGSWRVAEKRTLIVFGITALLWVTRTQPLGGWSMLLQSSLSMPPEYAQQFANDATVALLGTLALFLVPNGEGESLLNWDSAEQIPWGVLILFAGGLCIASAFKSSGLSELMGSMLAGLGSLNTLLLIAAVCLCVTFLTEVTSNTATTTLLMPILATAALAAAVDPKLFMVPATISASFAFMLPAATPPNAIVYGSESFSVGEMAREGIVLNLVGAVIVTVICYFTFG